MGSKLQSLVKEQDQFQKMLKNMKQKPVQLKITVYPEQKYLSVMIDKLSQSKLPEELKNRVSVALHSKITTQQLIKTVSIASVLKNNEFDQFAFKKSMLQNKQPAQTKNVFIKFSKINQYVKNKLQKGKSQITVQQVQHQLNDQEMKRVHEQQQIRQSQQKQNLELANNVLKKEIQKMHHPFWKLNKAFVDFIASDFMTMVEKVRDPKNQEKYQSLIRRLIYSWCDYIDQGCFYPYKKWLISFLELPDAKLKKFIQNIVLQQIFTINNHYLYNILIHIISIFKAPLKINFTAISMNMSQITPQLFSIDPKLQIQGHFFDSIYQCSELESIAKPQLILKQLQIIKNRICTDIDNYHRLTKKGQVYEIDSDNILGIVNYILCKIQNKIEEIYKQMILLRIVYGDNVYYTYGISSYMLSTIFGSIQFLEGQEFYTLLKEHPNINAKPISPPTFSKKSEIKENLILQKPQKQELKSQELSFSATQDTRKQEQNMNLNGSLLNKSISSNTNTDKNTFIIAQGQNQQDQKSQSQKLQQSALQFQRKQQIQFQQQKQMRHTYNENSQDYF